jgi:hypothetical protein
MRSDGESVPDLAEAVVLHRLDLVSSDQLPGLAARWLALDVVETEWARQLAGENPRDRWAIEQLLADSVRESDVTVPSDAAAAQRIAVDWVTAMWRESRDTRWAVGTLASLGQTNPASISGCSSVWMTSGKEAGVGLSRPPGRGRRRASTTV